jgi:hypothetical protein
MVIKRVSPLSCAKIAGTLYAAVGLVIGGIFSLAAMAGGFASSDSDVSLFGPVFGAIMGVRAIIVLPILYGVLGFIASLIGAALYNVVAGAVGGIEIEVQ